MRSQRNVDRRSGFTLIELLVVIAVMMILMGLLVAGAARLRITAMNEGSKAICQAFVTAIENYNNSYRAYPILIPRDPSGQMADVRTDNSGGTLGNAGTPFYTQFWDSGKNWWKVEAANAAVVYQMLLPVGQGPYLNASSNAIPMALPKDSAKQPVSITVNNILIRQVVDKFDNPVNIIWTGNAKFKQNRAPFSVGQTYWGSIKRENNTFTLKARDVEGDFTLSDMTTGNPPPVEPAFTGVQVWSSGQDGLVGTDDDIVPAVAGR